ncbi:MAG: RelA/SpoT family protein [Oscillospiraceae bacterium]
MSALLHNLINAIDESGRTYDKDLIVKAYEFARTAHEGQRRDSGEPYITHPLAVSCILVELGMDEASICAALLHDVVEDTPVTKEELASEFGEEISNLVDGVTKLSKIPLSTREEQQAENVRKMLFAMSQDIRVIIIKLADRLHNMRTLSFRPAQKQRDTSLETMEIYAPIAHRLGIRAVKEELEDLALQYLDPVALKEIEDTLQLKDATRKFFIPSTIERISDRLEEYDMKPHIEGRVKSLYGIYRKVYMAGRDFDEVYDIYAVRIITSTVIECYNILGIMHDMFTPIPNRFKDYISTPKANMYQSLHTTVLSKEGIPFEIQIRTWDMHYTAEYGIAAHWKYKLGIQGKDRQEERFAWIRRLVEAQQENENPEEIVYSIKNDLGAEDVFVFTPKGDVKSLPLGSTVIDFAYAIHSAVGNRMTGAKVDGRIVPIDYKVKTGDVVDIITSNSPNHGPNRAWLNIVKTGEARNKIRAWFKKERRTENVQEGKTEVEREFKRNQIVLPEKEMEEFLLAIAKRYHCNSLDDFFAAIGYGGILLSKIIARIKDDYLKNYKPKPESEIPVAPDIPRTPYKGSSGVVVEGIDNCLVKFSQCCTPLPGDPIIGFITRGHGVSIHKQDCVNVLASMRNAEQRDRWIAVHWADSAEKYYRCTLDIVAHDRNGLLADVTVELANFRVPVHEVFARELKNGNANIVVTIGIAGVEQLKNIMNKLAKIKDVISVERSGKQ